MPDPPSLSNGFHQEHANRVVTSYRHWVGCVLLTADPWSELGKQLFHAPFVVVSHGMEEDPIFNYGNQAALDLFEMTWSEFTSLPSRESAEPVNREERERLLDLVTKQEYIDDYSGVRISANGRRFFLPKAIVWNVIDEAGSRVGQAATFSEWQFL